MKTMWNLLSFFKDLSDFSLSPELEDIESLRKTGTVTEETKESEHYTQKLFKYVSDDGKTTIFSSTTESKNKKAAPNTRNTLERQLKDAVAEENYTLASELQKKIKELK